MSSEVSRRDLNIRTLEKDGITWVNVERPASAELEWLEANYGFHPMALHEGMTHGEMSTIDEFDTYLFLALHFPVFNEQIRLTLAAEVGIFVGQDYLVTMHNGDLAPLVSLFRQCEANEDFLEATVRGSTGFLLYNIIDALIDHCGSILNKVEENVDHVELVVFDESSRDLVREISFVRRDVIAYQRIIRHLLRVMEQLEAEEYPFLKVDPEVYFGDIVDHIRSIGGELQELKEVIEGLGDAHSTLITHHTNQIIRILTIMSAILLPLSVISSLYGMNVRLPLAGTPYAFGVVLGIMAGVAVAMLAFFRIRHWI